MGHETGLIVEYDGTLLALGRTDADRLMADGTVVPCSTCQPPCGFHHVSPDRLPDAVIDAGRPISSRPGTGRAALAGDRPLAAIQSSHTEHP